jgi:hypothetical protein
MTAPRLRLWPRDGGLTGLRLDEAVKSLATAGNGRLDPAGYLLLACAVRGLASDGRAPREPTRAAAFWAVVRALGQIEGGDILWLGRPAFVGHSVGHELTTELDALIGSAGSLPAIPGCERALRVSVGGELSKLVDRAGAPAFPMGDPSYFVHRGPSAPREPVIREPGEIRVLLALGNRGDVAFVLQTSSGTRRVAMSPGTVIIYHAGTTLIGLDALGGGDELRGLTCGFHSSRLPARRPPFVPTPEIVAERMLKLADVGPGDRVFDLGSGDGALVRAAARRGAKVVGIEIDAALAKSARATVLPGVEIRHADARDVNLRDATVVLMFLSPECNESLRDKLESELVRGARIVTHMWPLKGWKPHIVEQVVTREGSPPHRVFSYRR